MKNTREVGSQFLVIFTVFALFSIFGCTSAPEGYIEVSNRLRFSDTQLISNIASNSEIKIAVKQGGWGNNFMLYNIYIKQGYMTLWGDNGSITLLPDNKMLVSIKGYCNERVLPFAGHGIFFSCNDGLTKVMVSHVVGVAYNQLNEEFLKRNLTMENFCLHLSTIKTNNYFLINIPIKTSQNFVGYSGDLSISYNWYDDL